MKTFVWDTETSGLIKNSSIPLARQPYVIELAGVLLEDGEIIREVEFFAKPPISISAEITRITGITEEDLKDAKPFSANFEALQSALLDADEVVAHNLSYDFQVCNFEATRLRRELIWPSRKICTVEATEHIKGYRLTLTKLHEFLFGEPFEGAHRAMTDVKALAKCFLKLREVGEV